MNIDATTIATGAAVIDDRQILQAELARVNLLRIRGDISSSKTLCLSVLKRFPESIDAHVMMGDLHSEQGDLAPAAEWYSLALDLDRNAPGVAVKLARIQAALDISGHATKSRALIANSKQISPWLYVAIAASILSVITVGYIAGMGTQQRPVSQKSSISDRIESPKPMDAGSKSSPLTAVGTNSTPNGPQNNSVGPTPTSLPTTPPETKSTGTKETAMTVSDDQKYYEQVSNRSKYGKHVLSVIADPRAKSMILTYSVGEGDHGRYLGAILADVALEYEAKMMTVTIRGVRNGILSYVADVPREKIMAVEAREKKNVQDIENKDWIDDVLTNEYFKDKELMKESTP